MGTECDVVLLARTFESDQSFHESHVEWLRLIDSSNYSKAQTDLSAYVPGWFEGAYQDFQQKMSTYHSEEWFAKSDVVVSSRVRSYVPQAAFDAWATCVTNTHSGSGTIPLQCTNSDAEGVDVTVAWEPVHNTLGPLFNCGISITGGSAEAAPFWSSKPDVGFTGKTIFRVKRSTPQSLVSVRVYGTTKKGVNFIGNVRSEAPPPPAPPLTWYQDFKKANEGTLAIGPVPHDMSVEVTFIFTSSYEQEGDPTRTLRTSVDGQPLTFETKQSFGENDVLTAQTTRALKAGQTMSAKAEVATYHTKNECLVISARQL